MAPKFISPSEAAGLIQNNSTLWIEGASGGINEPGTLYEAVSKRFEYEGSPKNITLIHPNGVGDGKGRGVDLFAREGLISCCIGGHFGFSPQMVQLINDNKIEGYNIPQGILSQLIRDIAAGRPGLITHVGLNTFVDPRETGGALNKISKKELVEVINLNEKEYLFYPAPQIDVVFIRGTSADESGNISMEEEAAYLNMLSAAQAGHNNGIVIAQVKRKVKKDSLDHRLVKIPGILVDYIVVEENQWQTFNNEYNPSLSCFSKIAMENKISDKLDMKKVIARRAAMELMPGVINLGFGMSSLVANVAAEEGLTESITLTVEQGPVGGVPASGLIFGCSYNPQAIIDQPYQFDFYDGGGIDITFLGLAQADMDGNVNVSKFGSRIAGAGGFINITQGAKKIVYCGTFTASGLKVEIKNGKIKIIEEGKIIKFVNRVEHKTFSGQFAKERKTPVLFVTERAVFELTSEGLTLIEIAPGIDVKKDIMDKMQFKPIISKSLIEMDKRIFEDNKMNIKSEILQK